MSGSRCNRKIVLTGPAQERPDQIQFTPRCRSHASSQRSDEFVDAERELRVTLADHVLWEVLQVRTGGEARRPSVETPPFRKAVGGMVVWEKSPLAPPLPHVRSFVGQGDNYDVFVIGAEGGPDPFYDGTATVKNESMIIHLRPEDAQDFFIGAKNG